MTLHEELAKVASTVDTAFTIGIFDGVHLGHQHLLSQLQSLAIQQGLVPGVLTFRNHPRSVLSPGAGVAYITSLEERISRLRAAGIGKVVDLEFTQELSSLSAREFLVLLSSQLKMRGLVVGPDFAMGHNRDGTIPVIQEIGADLGFWVRTVDPVCSGQDPVRSSAIRRAIACGDVAGATQLLGRIYSLTGVVVHGEQRGGRLLGFPTANLELESDILVPENGIYATWATVEGKRFPSATNVGIRPTFGSGPKIVEAYIMDFEQDIYGKVLTLEFVQRLREELTFGSVDELIQQMKLDVEHARDILALEHITPRRG
jgi:riboflavin kinase/FMN adenylyltransferase